MECESHPRAAQRIGLFVVHTLVWFITSIPCYVMRNIDPSADAFKRIARFKHERTPPGNRWPNRSVQQQDQ